MSVKLDYEVPLFMNTLNPIERIWKVSGLHISASELISNMHLYIKNMLKLLKYTEKQIQRYCIIFAEH